MLEEPLKFTIGMNALHSQERALTIMSVVDAGLQFLPPSSRFAVRRCVQPHRHKPA
jgi:hypothetical protein